MRLHKDELTYITIRVTMALPDNGNTYMNAFEEKMWERREGREEPLTGNG